MSRNSHILSKSKSFIFILIFIAIISSLGYLYYYTISSNSLSNKNINTNAKTKLTSKSTKPVYEFTDPSKAFQILTLLDRYKPLSEDYNEGKKGNNLFFSIIKDDLYCRKVREYFTYHTKKLFSQNNIFLEHPHDSLTRNVVIPSVGVDVHPEIYKGMSRVDRQSAKHHLSPKISIIFLISGLHKVHYNYDLGKNFGCTIQMYNHIFGAVHINRKSNLANDYNLYVKNYNEKGLQHCVEQFMPDSYLLKKGIPCRRFFRYINSTEYQQEKQLHGFVFFKKIGKSAHEGKGVFLFDNTVEEQLRNEYQNGALCAQIRNDIQMQKYVVNPLLYKGFKFDFRVYMLVASTNPLIVYYHDGFLRLSVHKFDANSTSRSIHLSNTEVSKEMFKLLEKGGTWMGMNLTQLRNFQTTGYDSLYKYLKKEGKVTDPDWIEKHLKRQMKQIMVHVTRMEKEYFLRRSTLFEMFGFDFILDQNLKLWLIEVNSSPMLEATSDYKEKLLTKMLKNQFELIFSLLRSRMKRIILFVNELIDDMKSNNDEDGVIIRDYGLRKKKFDDINNNYMEPEFEIDDTNGFEKIIDENLNGTDIYTGFIKPECL